MEYLDSDARKQKRLRLSRNLPGFETPSQARERWANLINHLMAGDQAAGLVARGWEDAAKTGHAVPQLIPGAYVTYANPSYRTQ
jgi:hypothetical protein